MSRRQTRPPGSTVRRDTVRKRISEQMWVDARVERAEIAAKIAEPMRSMAEAFPIKEAGIARDLSTLADLYGDPLLREAAFRLAAYGLGGPDWRQVANASKGLEWHEDGSYVLAVEALIEEGHTPEAAFEKVAVAQAVRSQSFDGAVQAVKRAYLRWRDVGPEERRTAAEKAKGMREAPDPYAEWRAALARKAE